MRKLRHKEVKTIAQESTADMWQRHFLGRIEYILNVEKNRKWRKSIKMKIKINHITISNPIISFYQGLLILSYKMSKQ